MSLGRYILLNVNVSHFIHVKLEKRGSSNAYRQIKLFGEELSKTNSCWIYVAEMFFSKKKLKSSVYDCTVEDVEHIYNKLSIQTELVIDVFYILNSTVVD